MSKAETLSPLLDMLQYRRPAGSKTERRFIADYIEPLGVKRDDYGNLYKRIGNAPVLWSCHTDSVHKEGGKQNIAIVHNHAQLSFASRSNCLGADDAVGVYLMREMILAQRPGLYVFHRAEEIGGKGSQAIAFDTPELLAGIGFAVAFDRKGNGDVITHQAGGRCCSDAFANSLATALGGRYAPSDQGLFTDTANYTDLIGECTNVSVGYQHEHTTREAVDLAHVLDLREAALSLDCNAFAFVRQAGEVDPDDYGGWPSWMDDVDQTPKGKQPHSAMVGLVRDYPDIVADVLADYGFDYQALGDEIWSRGGPRQ
jgi:hypothetical protein